MSEKRYSFWQVTLFIIAFLGIAALSCGAGLAVGYNWGIERGRAQLLEKGLSFLDQLTPRSMMDRLPLPELPFQQERGRPYLGVTFITITPQLAEQRGLELDEGALITDVIDGSPAARAELEPGDIILAVQGEPVWLEEPLSAHILAHQPGDQIELEVLRHGRFIVVEVRLGRAPSS